MKSYKQHDVAVIPINTPENRWLPHSLVFDILDYLNDELAEIKVKHILDKQLLPRSQPGEVYADLWVKLEALGDITIRLAKILAKAVADFLPRQISLNIAKNSADLTNDDRLFLKYLSEYCVVSINEDNSVYPLRQNKNYLIWFIKIPTTNSDIITSIIEHAWELARLGAEEKAIALLEHAIQTTAITNLKKVYLLQLQYIRIATQHYEAAAEEYRMFFEEDDPQFTKYMLTKAWGNILIKRIDAAGYYFPKAQLTMETYQSCEDLYALNIFALYQFRNGFTHCALEIENYIANTLKQNNQTTPMYYINNLNLARLYRSLGNYSNAKWYYQRAFTTAGMVKEEVSLIYENVCYAIMGEQACEFDSALLFWIQAALLWLTSEHKEALGWRTIRALGHLHFKPHDILEINAIANLFFERIFHLAQIKISDMRLDLIISIKKTVGRIKNPNYIVIGNIALLASHDHKTKPTVIDTMSKLRALVANVMAHQQNWDVLTYNQFFLI